MPRVSYKIVRRVSKFAGQPAHAHETLPVTPAQPPLISSIMDKSPAVVFRWDAVSSKTEFVSEAIRQFGYTPEDFTSIGTSIWDCIHESDRERLSGMIMDYFSKNVDEYSFEFRVLTKARSVRWVYCLTWAIRNPAGQRTSFQGIMVDITNRVRDEETIERERQRLTATLSGIGDAVISVDALGRVTLLNQVATELTGWGQREALGRQLSEVFNIIDEVTRQPAPSPTERFAHESGAVDPTDRMILISRDSTERFIEYNLAAMSSEDDMPLGAILVFRDVTHRRARERALIQSEERFRLLVDNSTDIICRYFLPEHCWDYVSPSVQTILGYPPEMFYREGDAMFGFVHAEDRAALRSFVDGESAPGTPKLFRVYHRNGDLRWLEARANTVRDSGGKVTFVHASLRDVTKRVLVEQQLKYQSQHDRLTDLYNRVYFEDELRKQQNAGQYPITLITADLDGLKLINDSLGHPKGDRMLQTFARVLRSAFRRTDIVSRIGGDEFGVILPGTDSTRAEQLWRGLEAKLFEQNQQLDSPPISVSVGIATTDTSEMSLFEALTQADRNMYRDKVHRSTTYAHGLVKTLLAALAAKDFIAEGHIDRVTRMCVRLGEAIGLSKKRIAELALLAEVHDLGKVGVPDRILFKAGLLTEEEREEIKQHPAIGYRIARSSPELTHIAEPVLHHHEWWNGLGYPSGLKGPDIPLACRVLAIVDAYDAMTNDRPYSRAVSPREAVGELLKGSGSQFDPVLVARFLDIMNLTSSESGAGRESMEARRQLSLTRN